MMKTQETLSRLVRATDVANHLDVHRATIYRLAKAGKIPFVYVGNAMRFDLSDVMTALVDGQLEEAATA